MMPPVMPDKTFKIPAAAMRPLAEGRGFCYATDAITCQGRRVGYCYREPPDSADDSGWRFFSGTESPQELDDPAQTDIYDVNTIANYDPAIIPLLDSPPGSAFERSGFFRKKFVAVPFEAADEGDEGQT
jgi:hypothetical protein